MLGGGGGLGPKRKPKQEADTWCPVYVLGLRCMTGTREKGHFCLIWAVYLHRIGFMRALPGLHDSFTSMSHQISRQKHWGVRDVA